MSKSTKPATKTVAATDNKFDANGVKKTSNYRTDGGLTRLHVRLLGVLDKAGKLVSVEKLAAILKIASPKVINWAFGSIKADNRDPLSLMARGYVKFKGGKAESSAKDGGGRTEYLYEITPSGRKALAKAVAEAAAKAQEKKVVANSKPKKAAA